MTEKNNEQADLTVKEAVVPAGTILRNERERLGLSIMDVAGQIKFAPRQIEALEAGDFERLPEMAFVRGFVRSYAKILKLDAQELLATLTPEKETGSELTPTSVEVPFPDASIVQRQNLIWLGLALIVVVMAVFMMRSTSEPVQQAEIKVETPVSLPAEVDLTIEPDNKAQNAMVQAETPVAEKTAPAAAKEKTPAPSVQTAAKVVQPAVSQTQPKPAPVIREPGVIPQLGALRIEFIEESWLEVKDGEENILSSQNYQAGSEIRLEGILPLSVLVGHAPSVRLYYKDKQVDLVPHTRRSTDVAHVMLK